MSLVMQTCDLSRGIKMLEEVLWHVPKKKKSGIDNYFEIFKMGNYIFLI